MLIENLWLKQRTRGQRCHQRKRSERERERDCLYLTKKEITIKY
jgi:hypothetical protein